MHGRSQDHPAKSRPDRPKHPYLYVARGLIWDHEHRQRMGVSLWTYLKLLDLRTHANGQVLFGRCLSIEVWSVLLGPPGKPMPERTVRRDFKTLRDPAYPYLTAYGGQRVGFSLFVRKSKGWKQDGDGAQLVAAALDRLAHEIRPHAAAIAAIPEGQSGHATGSMRPHAAASITTERSVALVYGSNRNNENGDRALPPPEGAGALAWQEEVSAFERDHPELAIRMRRAGGGEVPNELEAAAQKKRRRLEAEDAPD